MIPLQQQKFLHDVCESIERLLSVSDQVDMSAGKPIELRLEDCIVTLNVRPKTEKRGHHD